MKNRYKIKIYLSVIMIIFSLIIPFRCDNANDINKQDFFTVDSNTKTAGSILEMVINLKSVNYEDFKFTLTGQNIKSNMEANITENVDVEANNNMLIINGNKTDMNMSEIKLYYKIPQDIETGSVIRFKAEIEEAESNLDVQEMIPNIEEKPDEKNDNTETKQTIEITITIVAEEDKNVQEKPDQEEPNKGNQSNGNQINQGNKEEIVTNEENKKQENSNNEQSQNNVGQFVQNTEKTTILQNTNSTSKNISYSSQTETIKYNGSDNNYLKSIEIDGYEINGEFIKEKSTYFVSIGEEEVKTLNITALADESSAKICIYGNEKVKDGSKVLICVTAENGNVRNYRIFITK